MKPTYRTFIRSRAKQVLIVSLALALLGTLTFYTSSEVSIGYAFLWFVFMLSLSFSFLVLLHSLLFFLFKR